jgi:hypothetical protein
MSQGCHYMKDVKRSTFAVEWIPFFIMDMSIGFLIYIPIILGFNIIFTHEFLIKDYFYQGIFLFRLSIFLFVVFIFDFLRARKIYRLIKEKSFSSIDDKRLVLYFGKDSFLWGQVKEVIVEGERKVTITFAEEERQKKKVNDLKWLTGKDDFIRNLKRACTERNIPCRESEMTLSSRVGLILRMMKRSSFEPLPERK